MTVPDTEALREEPFVLGYRPEFDGIRGVAIGFVLIYHYFFERLFIGGYIGVDVFFVLSGFLITVILLEERRSTGAIRLGNFYARRALRLLPALVVVLSFVVMYAALADRWSGVQMFRRAIYALLYVANWVVAFEIDLMEPIGYTWSLSIEEQFYLLWPFALLLMARFIGDARRIAIVLAAAVVAVGLWRSYVYWDVGIIRSFNGTDTRADSLLAGCLVGVLAVRGMLPTSAGVKRLVRAGAVVTAIGLVYILWAVPFTVPWMNTVGHTAVAVGVAVVLIDLLSADSPLRIPLRWRWLVRLGVISYGVYLWHPVVNLIPPVRFVTDRVAYPVQALILTTTTLVVAALSYRFVEKPLLALKRSFGGERPGSEGR